MKPQQRLFAKIKGLRLRKDPNASGTSNVLKTLKEGEELTFVDGPWLRVKVGKTEGWVHADYVSEATPQPQGTFTVGVPNLAHDPMSLAVRKEIGDMYGGGKSGWELQCTEYTTYRIKTKLGITISWPVTSGRHGGKWGAIFKKHGTYPVSATPKVNCAMSFTTGISTNPATNDIGHVAFVEEVFPNGSIRISEANWPRNGIYNGRILTKQEWQDKYKAEFIAF